MRRFGSAAGLLTVDDDLTAVVGVTGGCVAGSAVVDAVDDESCSIGFNVIFNGFYLENERQTMYLHLTRQHYFLHQSTLLDHQRHSPLPSC